MEQIGKVFRQLRESRNISLRQATGGQFSPSMLSRFETGQSELSVEKFLFALENISASVEEILPVVLQVTDPPGRGAEEEHVEGSGLCSACARYVKDVCFSTECLAEALCYLTRRARRRAVENTNLAHIILAMIC